MKKPQTTQQFLLKGTQDGIQSKFILLLLKKQAQNDEGITQLDGRVNESLQTLPGIILLHIFQLHFCFLCGLKYTTEIHAHILENIQKVNADQIKDLQECKCYFLCVVVHSLCSPILTKLPSPFSVSQQHVRLIGNVAHITFAFFI